MQDRGIHGGLEGHWSKTLWPGGDSPPGWLDAVQRAIASRGGLCDLLGAPPSHLGLGLVQCRWQQVSGPSAAEQKGLK